MTMLSVPLPPPAQRVIRRRRSTADAWIVGTFGALGLASTAIAVGGYRAEDGRLLWLGVYLALMCLALTFIAAASAVNRAPELHYISRCGSEVPWAEVEWRDGVACCRECRACGTAEVSSCA